MLPMILDEDLNDPGKVALYGADTIAAERAARERAQRRVYGHGDSIDLRGDDLPAPDPFEAERARAGHLFDPVVAAGMRAASKSYGDPFDREVARREQERRRQTQRSQYEVALGAVVTLRDGTQLGEGAALTRELVAHPHASEVIQRLVTRGCVSEVDPHLAWLRSLDASIGPYVVVAETLQVGARMLRRGQGVSEADFPPLEQPRSISDDTPLSELCVRDLKRLTNLELDVRMPRSFDLPPPRSAFDTALLFSHAIEQAPNYVPLTQRKAKQ
jgi:hypothetical protein